MYQFEWYQTTIVVKWKIKKIMSENFEETCMANYMIQFDVMNLSNFLLLRLSITCEL